MENAKRDVVAVIASLAFVSISAVPDCAAESVATVANCWTAAAKSFVAASGGEPITGDFRLNYWNVPPVLPADTDFPIKVSFTRIKGNPHAVISASLIGDWSHNAGWMIEKVRSLRLEQTGEAIVLIRTPEQPGDYRLRLFLRQDQRPTPEFAGLHDHVWSEVVIRVVTTSGARLANP